MAGHTDRELDAFGDWERLAWEERAAPYAASLGDLTRGSIPALLDAADVGPGCRVLDVGCGPGFVALAAAARGAVVVGADQSRAMVTIARAAGVGAVVTSVARLPFRAGVFGAVVAGYLLNHLPRPEVAVASLARVLRPGGRMAMTVWDLPEANPALGLFGPVVTELGLRGVVPPGPDPQRFSAEAELRRLLEGWREVAVDRLGWTVTVDPWAWFDAVADATPRTGAVLAQAAPEQRAQARARYVAVATASYGCVDGRVELPAGAVLASAIRW
jgi:SAM-dependent methyltransferase